MSRDLQGFQDPLDTGSPRQRATLLDVGVGNLGNLSRAVARLGAEAEITDDPATVAAARCLLLPGVGAFHPPRERLRGALEDALHQALDDGAWLLGICVGFQLLFESSVEFGDTDGLGLLPGRITRLPSGVPLPHIGWNRLHGYPGPTGPGGDNGRGLLDGVPEGSYVYFVHSFAPEGVPDDRVLARATHGRAFPAVVGKGRVLGTQFHPEKSGEHGLRIYANFLRGAEATIAGRAAATAEG